MKTIHGTLVLFCIIFSLQSCHSQVQKDFPKEFYPLEITSDYSRSEAYKVGENEIYFNYYLKEPKVILTFPCKGKFTLTENGNMNSCTLSKSHEIKGNVIPAGSGYFSYSMILQNGFSVNLSKDTIVAGFPVKHKNSGYRDMVFYNNGTPHKFCLAVPHKIGNINCQGGGRNDWVKLFPNGKLLECRLAEETKIEDTLYPKGALLIFNDDGSLHYLSNKVKWAYYYNNGVPRECKLKYDMEIDKKQYEMNTILHFDNFGYIVHSRK